MGRGSGFQSLNLADDLAARKVKVLSIFQIFNAGSLVHHIVSKSNEPQSAAHGPGMSVEMHR